MNLFYLELKYTLEKTLEWAQNFKKGQKDYNFDIDDELYYIGKRHHIKLKKNETILLIYNFLDFYCDAIKHEFNEVILEFSISDAEACIKSIITEMEYFDDLSSFQLPSGLEKKLKLI